MAAEKFESTLREFAQKLAEGYGWWRPSAPRAIGQELLARVPEDLLDTAVAVEYEKFSGGHGPDAHTLYRWVVRSLPGSPDLPRWKEVLVGRNPEVEALFGRDRRSEPSVGDYPGGGWMLCVG